MCDPLSLSITTAVIGGGLQAYGTYQQASYQKAAAKANAVEAERAAVDAKMRGDKEAMQLRRQGDLLRGSQRASLASRGLDLTSGTPDELLAQTDFFSLSDQVTARNNGRTEAASLRSRGAQYRAEAKSVSPGLNTAGSLLGSASSVADKWHMFTK